MAEDSDFLSGRNGKWTSCNFDWLINENNMVKVLEGNYKNKGKKSGLDVLKELWDEGEDGMTPQETKKLFMILMVSYPKFYPTEEKEKQIDYD